VEAAPIPDNEADRQAALERYDILDTLSEQCYDDITALMSGVCNAPISLVGLIDNDRNWLKSCHGVDLSESPRMISFCGHAIISEEPVFVVPDARKDPRFEDNPLVVEQGVVGYAGAPLIDRDGYALGTLCVFHTEPLDLDKRQLNSLLSMSRQVMRLLESHLRERMLERASDNLASRNEQLKSFVGTVAHDILGPVTSIAALLEIIEEDVDDVELRGDLERVRQSSVTLRGYVDDLLSHYVQGGGEFDSQIGVQLQCLFASLETLVVSDTRVTLVYPDTDITIHTHRSVLFQVLLNLVALTKKKALESGWPLSADCSTRLVAESRSSRRSGRGAHLLLRSPKVRVTRQRTRALRRPVVLSALEPGVGASACWCISTIVWCVRKRDTLTELLVCQNLH